MTITFSNGDSVLYALPTSKPKIDLLERLTVFNTPFGKEQVYFNKDIHYSYFSYNGYWFSKRGWIKNDFYNCNLSTTDKISYNYKMFQGEMVPKYDIMRFNHFNQVQTKSGQIVENVYGFHAVKSTNKALTFTNKCILIYEEIDYEEKSTTSWSQWTRKTKNSYIAVHDVNKLLVTSDYSFFLAGSDIEFLNERQLKISGLL